MSEALSRRDFLKFATVIGTGVLVGCGLKRPSSFIDFEPVACSRETVIFNGKPTLITDLPSKARNLYDKINDSLKFSHSNTEGYEGAPFPYNKGWTFDNDKVVVRIDNTDTGELIGQALIGRKKDPNVYTPENEEVTEWDKFWAGLTSASAYGDHSLLVISENGTEYWFDNVSSEVGSTRVRIVVDTKNGKIYQIKLKNPNWAQRWFQGKNIEIEINEIDILKNEPGFYGYTISLFTKSFINLLISFSEAVKRKLITENPNISEEDLKRKILDAVLDIFTKSRFSEEDIEVLKTYIGSDDLANFFLNVLTRYSQVPLTFEEYLIALKGLSDNLLSILEKGLGKRTLEEILIKTINPFNQHIKIKEKKVYIPQGQPDVYVIKISDGKKTIYFLVGFYNYLENGIDRSVIGDRNKFSLHTQPIPFVYGKISETLANQYDLLVNLNSCQNPPIDFKQLAQREDQNPNNDLWPYSIDEKYKKEFMRVKPEAVRWFFNPVNGKIETGIVVNSKRGEERVMILGLDDPLGNNINNLRQFRNRWLPLVGNSPTMLVDVTDKVEELRAKGFIDTSIIGLSPIFHVLLITRLPPNEEEYLLAIQNIAKTDKELGEFLLKQLQKPNFFNIDQNLLVYASAIKITEAGEKTPVYIYKFDRSGNIITKIPLPDNMIFEIHELGTTISGENYATIAKIDGTQYAIRVEDIFPLAARSNLNLFLREAFNLALMYGGYRLLRIPEIERYVVDPVKILLKGIFELIFRLYLINK